MLKVFRILLYSVGGYFIWMGSVLSFFSYASSNSTIKWIVAAIPGIVGISLVFAGMATNRFKTWKFSLGTILLLLEGFNILGLISIICGLIAAQESPELAKSLPPLHLHGVTFDYMGGGIINVCFFIIGISLVRSNSKSSIINQKRSADD